MRKSWLLVLIVASFTAGCTRSTVDQASKEFNGLPPVVQQVVRSTAPNAEIADVETRVRNGQTTYVVQFRDSKVYPDMEIAADGRLMKYEAGTAARGGPGVVQEVEKGGASVQSSLSALPLGLQKAVAANAPKAEVVAIHRHEENGRIYYEVEYAGRDPKPVLYVTPEGEILKKEALNPPSR